MKNYEAYKSFQVLGANIKNILDAFGAFSLLVGKIMVQENLGTEAPDGRILFDPDKWYPLESNLRAIERIQDEYGSVIIRQMTAALLHNSKFSPAVSDIESGLASVDIAYHLNHARSGMPLFSPETGQMGEGIGHYTCTPVPGRKQVVCEVNTPYSCIFDQGLLQAMAYRFQPSATLVHQNPSHCRNKGFAACSYSITWK